MTFRKHLCFGKFGEGSPLALFLGKGPWMALFQLW